MLAVRCSGTPSCMTPRRLSDCLIWSYEQICVAESTIPRTVGRRIKRSLTHGDDGKEIAEEQAFVGAQAARVSHETRKVLRLAAWDLRERHRAGMEDRGKEVRRAEEAQKSAVRAMEFFKGVSGRTTMVREEAGLMLIA